MSIEDKLADLTADLVECEANHAFLERLFAVAPGVWTDVAVLCHDITPIKDHMTPLQTSSVGPLHATWTDYPPSTHGKGYCLIIFFAEAWHWSSVALYNKQWFLNKHARQARTVT